MSETIVGIDLGTTNSEVAAFHNGEVRVLGPGSRMLPSCVAMTPAGALLVGEAARNQQLLYPERTIRSIKRKMGMGETVDLGGRTFTPPEISSLILRELAEWAARDLGATPKRAVITVPAYFSDTQRNATREAGALAGLEVVRILNEPTAGSLAYGSGGAGRHTAMVYDLGGGTFDVSIVTVEGDVTEVLSSHGNNNLGGDDFDDLLTERLMREFLTQHGVDVRKGQPLARARLRWAAEEAKKQLSFEPYVKIREEALLVDGGQPLHLEMEISRTEYEEMIRPLVESTLHSVSKALSDASLQASALDAILLVGGATRTPLVSQLLQERTGLEPRQDVHPDLCVALGAGVLASRLSGHEIERVLVDVSPFSFGPSYLGDRGGVPYPYCYRPLIRRNTPLPVTRTNAYYTSYPRQTAVEIQIFQGEDDDALKNIPVGDFRVEGLTATTEPNEVLCRMSLDLDGILLVTAIEKATGLSKQVTIQNVLQTKSPEEIAAARRKLEEMFQAGRAAAGEGGYGALPLEDSLEMETEEEPEQTPGPSAKVTVMPLPEGDSNWARQRRAASELVARSQGLLERMHGDDREEAIQLHEQIAMAQDAEAIESAMKALSELLFFVEGR
ncbi:MAG: Hsp70 family protein [Bryobacterales bacterium]|nr:Hsp70 family protein [Bryobacterales bacterium]